MRRLIPCLGDNTRPPRPPEAPVHPEAAVLPEAAAAPQMPPERKPPERKPPERKPPDPEPSHPLSLSLTLSLSLSLSLSHSLSLSLPPSDSPISPNSPTSPISPSASSLGSSLLTTRDQMNFRTLCDETPPPTTPSCTDYDQLVADVSSLSLSLAQETKDRVGLHRPPGP